MQCKLRQSCMRAGRVVVDRLCLRVGELFLYGEVWVCWVVGYVGEKDKKREKKEDKSQQDLVQSKKCWVVMGGIWCKERDGWGRERERCRVVKCLYKCVCVCADGWIDGWSICV